MSVPVRATSTSASSARRFGSKPSAKRAAAAEERTISDPTPASDVVMASGIANARKSLSASGRRMRKGRTISRVTRCATTSAPASEISITSRRSFAIAAAEG